MMMRVCSRIRVLTLGSRACGRVAIQRRYVVHNDSAVRSGDVSLDLEDGPQQVGIEDVAWAPIANDAAAIERDEARRVARGESQIVERRDDELAGACELVQPPQCVEGMTRVEPGDRLV